MGLPKLLVLLLVSCASLIAENPKGQITYQVPYKPVRSLILSWEIPEISDSRPEILIGFLLCHEGEGSLLAALKREKLADKIEWETVTKPQVTEFSLKIHLSALGIKKVYNVMDRCFQTIALLKEQEIPLYLEDELQRLAKIEGLSFQKIGAEKASQFIASLSPLNANFVLQAAENELPVKFEDNDQRSTVRPMAAAKLTAWSSITPHPELALPKENPYIPNKLELFSTLDTEGSLIPHPRLIINQECGQVYFVQDTRFKVPQISWSFEIKSPEIDAEIPKKAALVDLYVLAVKEAFQASAYPARLAGLDFALKSTTNGIEILIDGYNDHADLLLFELVNCLKKLKVSPSKFKMHKDTLQSIYQHEISETPLLQAMNQMRGVLFKSHSTAKDREFAAKKLTYEAFEEFCASIFKKIYIESMLYGNMTQSQAEQLSQKLFASFSSKPYLKYEQLKKKLLILPEDKGPHFVEIKAKTKGNVTILAIQEIPFTFKSHAAQQILMQALKEPFAQTISKAEPNASILTTSEEIDQFLFNFFAVQSYNNDSRDLLARFELFIEDFLQKVKNREFSAEHFEKIKKNLMVTLSQQPRTLIETADLLRHYAFKYEGDFDWPEKELQGVQELTYHDFLEFSAKALGKQNKRRLGLFFNGAIPPLTTLQYKRLATTGQIKQLSEYKDAVAQEEL